MESRRSASPLSGGPGRPRRRAGAPVPLVGAVAALGSGLPSTVHALATGGDLLQATRAAATLVPGRPDRRGRDRREVMLGVAVHLVVSAGWTVVLTAVDRRRRLGLPGGITAGLLIAALDLEIIGRSRPAIRALPRLPQWLDHIAFGAIVGVLLGGRGGLEPRPDPPPPA
ncbi:hypothetical protein ACRYCC_37610 [Actinomadura scrupuli]|uniref:hypothetical protein n=1 Tax=Actinomadura scrupuli TaxID=559629 RepID=UPI003D9547C6